MIRINLDVMLAKRKMSLTELAEKVGITLANLSVLKTGKAKAVRFSTLDALCRALNFKTLFALLPAWQQEGIVREVPRCSDKHIPCTQGRKGR